jgi:GYF domain 2
MAQRWFYTQDGRTALGPFTADELRERARTGQLLRTDQVQAEGSKRWLRADQMTGLFPAEVEAVPVLPVEEVPTEVRLVAPVSVTRELPVPVLVARSAVCARELGDYVAAQFARCWNELDQAGLPAADLLYFGSTRTRRKVGAVEAAGQTALNILSGKTAEEPLFHLALFPEEVALVWAGKDGRPAAERFRFDAVAWTFSGGSGPAVLLKMKAAGTERVLSVSRGPWLDRLRQLLADRAVTRAEAHAQAGRYHQADALLAAVPAESAADLRQRVAAIASVAADYAGGHPDHWTPRRGVLRLDAQGLEFAVPGTGSSLRLSAEAIDRILEPRQGRIPQEILAALQQQQRSEKTGQVALGLMLGPLGNLISAGTGGGRLGVATVNRLVVVLKSAFGGARVHFDTAGKDPATADANALTFWSVVHADLLRRRRVGPDKGRAHAAGVAETWKPGGESGGGGEVKDLFKGGKKSKGHGDKDKDKEREEEFDAEKDKTDPENELAGDEELPEGADEDTGIGEDRADEMSDSADDENWDSASGDDGRSDLGGGAEFSDSVFDTSTPDRDAGSAPPDLGGGDK